MTELWALLLLGNVTYLKVLFVPLYIEGMGSSIIITKSITILKNLCPL